MGTAGYGSSKGYPWENEAVCCVPALEQDDEPGRNVEHFTYWAELFGFYPQEKAVTLKRFEMRRQFRVLKTSF